MKIPTTVRRTYLLSVSFKVKPQRKIIFLRYQYSHGKTVFCSIQYKNGCLTASDLSPFGRSVCFSVTISGNCERFQYKTVFLQNRDTFIKKWSFDTEIENYYYKKILRLKTHHFPDKIVVSEANVEANRKVSTKWTYHREGRIASNSSTFLKILFQFKNIL